MIGIGGYRWSLRGTKVRQPMQCVILLIAGALFSPISAFGSEVSLSANPPSCSPEQSLRWRGGTLRLENDLFTGSDRNYTNGVALTAVSRDLQGGLRPECLPQPIGLYARFIGWADPGFWRDSGAQTSSQNLVVRFGQSMYTPENKTRTDVIPDDRPYAGLLYLGLAWNRRVHPQAASYEMLDVRELTLGVIGPWSLAEQSQDLVHRARGIERFRGWDNQLQRAGVSDGHGAQVQAVHGGCGPPWMGQRRDRQLCPAGRKHRNRRQYRRGVSRGLEHTERLRQLSDPPWRREPPALWCCRSAHDNAAVGPGAQTWGTCLPESGG